ncbi:MAG: hypothetical protein IJV88_07205 [Ruminococcus sp.]|nr:hypothetical protein [Ruminococcus sp.]
MKRILALLLALMMVFLLCACGDSDSDDKDKSGDNSSSQGDASDQEGGPSAQEVYRGRIDSIDLNDAFVAGIREDGTVVATGGTSFSQGFSTDDWENITKVSVGSNHIVGLCSDGTVLATGYNASGQCDVADWTDIVDIHAGNQVTLGVKSDGTVVATGGADAYEDWKNVISVTGRGDAAYGLTEAGEVYAPWDSSPCATDVRSIHSNASYALFVKNDGTVTCSDPDNYGVYCPDIESFGDITDVAVCHSNLSAGLRSDGTVVATGPVNDVGQLDTEEWTDIVAVAVGNYHTVGLCSDGTVVATGGNGYGQCDVEQWTDIVAIWAENVYTLGLRADGTIVVAGQFGSWEPYDFSVFTDIKTR